jgi:hypothetical protein
MSILAGYDSLLGSIAGLLESARRTAARSVNALMTATYWLIGHRIVEFEQVGAARAEYGAELLKRLSGDLSTRFGRGFSIDNLETMRAFYIIYKPEEISETLSRILPAEDDYYPVNPAHPYELKMKGSL